MDLKLFMTVFSSVFLAELGDKTQLATLMFAAKSQKALTVFMASALALITTSFLGAFAGAWIGEHLPQHLIKVGSGILFIIIGLLILLAKG